MAGFYIEDWMIERERLKGLDLLAFALIHSCTQKGDGCWHGGYDKLAERTGATQRGIVKCIKSLEQAGYIKKFDVTIDGRNKKALKSLRPSELSSSEQSSSEQNSENGVLFSSELRSDNNKYNNKKEEDTNVSSKKERIDYDAVMAMWNTSMTRKVAKIQKISDSRKEKIRLRVAEMGGWEKAIETLRECFKKINQSDFCNGQNDRKWKPDFDWFFENDKNWLKVFEGKYENPDGKPKDEKLISSKDIFKMMGQ